MSRPSHTKGKWLTDVCIWTVPILVAGISAWLAADILWRGMGQISWEFLFTAPRSSGRAGGIAPILVSTALVVSVAAAVALPLALGTAILLTDFLPTSSRTGRWIRHSLDILAGVPSIVFGLVGNVVFCNFLGLGFSLLAGGLTLACMVLPIVMRAAEQSLRGIPIGCRHGAVALGMPRYRAVLQVLVPIALPGILDGLLLGIGRALAETAALVYTSGYVDRMPGSLSDSGRTLAVHIFLLVLSGLSAAVSRFSQAQ
jgi:phosphate transport system permease protein